MDRKLYRSTVDRRLSGVCGGIAEYLGIDSTIVRLIWAILSLVSLGTGVIVYAIAWIIMPEG